MEQLSILVDQGGILGGRVVEVFMFDEGSVLQAGTGPDEAWRGQLAPRERFNSYAAERSSCEVRSCHRQAGRAARRVCRSGAGWPL
jgi:hypothetical protein